jgi:GT2 family glycosyltransferase
MEACLTGLAQQELRAKPEVILIDNQSRPENRRAVEAMAATLLPKSFWVRHLAYDAPFNKSAQDNLGAASAAGEVVVFLNNDARLVDRETLQILTDWATVEGVASAGPRFIGKGGRLVSSGVHTYPAVAGKPAFIRENECDELSRTVHYTAGNSFACAAVSKAAWGRIGALDEEVFKGQYNDADFDLRALEGGFRHVFVGSVECYHEPGRSETRTIEHVRALHRQLIERYPNVGQYHALDPQLRPLKQRVDLERWRDRLPAPLRRIAKWGVRAARLAAGAR